MSSIAKAQPKPRSPKKGSAFFLSNLSGWLVMLPSLILFGFYVWEPLVASVVFSFSQTKGFKIEGFAGITNYIEVFTDSVFLKALQNTVYYTVCSLIIGYLVPIVLAVMLSELVHAKGFFRVGIYFPNVVPGIATILMWQFLLYPGKDGIINSIFGTESLWYQNPTWTIPIIVFILTWKSCGSTALIYLAALQSINQELYEAAAIDGAGIWSRIRYVTLPCIYNNARSMLILQVLSVFQVLYEPMVMTSGGPNNASLSLMLLDYNYIFKGKTEAGKAAALGVVICIILLILTMIYNKLVRAQDE